MQHPRNHQYVKVTFKDGRTTSARFCASHTTLGGEPGYDFHDDEKSCFCGAGNVTSWEDDSANDPLGYDRSNPPDEKETDDVP